MGKKSQSKKARPDTVSRERLRTAPNWVLLGISIVGMLLTTYLTFTSLTGSSVKGCSAGSACDVVLSSRWATMFGLPTSLWGFLAYAGLAAIAFIKGAEKHWRFAWTASLLGLAYSVYLSTVSLTVLKAACPYCLTSLSLMIAAFAVTTFQRPTELAPLGRWLARRVPLAAVFVFAMHIQYVALPTVPEDPIAKPLAEHLTRIGAKFYGASWCEHCQQQKKYFGQSAELLPYIECKPGGPNAPLTPPCREKYISTFPTWVINDQRIEGVLTLSDLADISQFKSRSATN